LRLKNPIDPDSQQQHLEERLTVKLRKKIEKKEQEEKERRRREEEL
jgi:hypothetical protein